MNRVLVLWCPDWPVVSSVGADALVALVAVVAGGQVVACSAAARAAGVRRRMRVREAQSRCPGLRLVERDIAAEARDFEPLAVRIERLVVPRLEVLRPGLLAFPARGAARYWGGEEALAARTGEVVAQAGFDGRTGVADTLFAAALAARSGRTERPGCSGRSDRTGAEGLIVPGGGTEAFLAPYPVGVLGQRELTELLGRLGLGTLGDLAALPTDRVLARFGPAGAAAHRTARGLEARVPRTRIAGEDRAVAVEFEPPERRIEPVVFRAKALADELHGGLRAAGVACSRVEVRIHLADGRRLARMWRHEGLSALAVAERVRWQLTAWHERGALAAVDGTTGTIPAPHPTDTPHPADAGNPPEDKDVGASGITRFTLVPDGLRPEEGRQGELFGSGASTWEEVERAAARLQAMLGHGAVTRARLGAGRGPGEQVSRVPFGESVEERTATGPWPGRLPAPHPAVVYQDALPARLVDAAGALVEVSGRAALSAAPVTLGVEGRRTARVTGWAGPWPVLEQWWDRDRAQRVARLQVATSDGRAWLLLVSGGRWHAEACYG